MEKNEQKRARRLLEMLRQAANSLFRRFPLRNPVWVGFGSNGKVTEFSIGKSSENAENPDEIERFQPDLVGVSGFEPEASWSRRLVGYFSRTFQVISAPFRSENFTAASFPARIIPPDFSAFGSRFGSDQKASGAKLRRCKQRLSLFISSCYSTQFSTSKSGTRSNSRTLFVTRIMSSDLACAAISISNGPIGAPLR